jgi:hypothetical protein
MPAVELAEPWRSFLAEVDSRLTEKVHLHCCGGFVATQLYGVARTTSDVDFLGVVPNTPGDLIELAGKGSALRIKYGIYLEHVTVATTPQDYEERLIPMYPATWVHLHLYALEAHDLALSKLQRNIERDRDDIQHLAREGHIRPEILKERYYNELRPYLVNEDWHDGTLGMWLESYWPTNPS